MGQDHCDHDPTQTSSTPDLSQDNDADIDTGLGYNFMYLLYWTLLGDQLRAAEGLSEGLEIDIDCCDRFGYAPLTLAAYRGSCHVARKLLASGADFNAQDTNGLAALHIAACEEYSPIVELLLPKPKLDVNTQDIEGLTALHDAAYEGRLLSLKLLLQHTGIIVNAQDKCGLTALHKAAKDICQLSSFSCNILRWTSMCETLEDVRHCGGRLCTNLKLQAGCLTIPRSP
ncbi:ankyrin repeat-containing domain protein [Aspergillus welwitschiae]|uniref:Ankyrin repeat-containing domain protein n=1 Tax=Aspergillus welwitschiae TaxID=1341132 RepID=A0A3F3PHB7_9EURO|nr:ankyrin repeat-containing domain protein [Aspergillus welwitschiae]RDH26247.1 ankyrin repeat-containing domain protein [Aspergillus welwitschiae]